MDQPNKIIAKLERENKKITVENVLEEMDWGKYIRYYNGNKFVWGDLQLNGEFNLEDLEALTIALKNDVEEKFVEESIKAVTNDFTGEIM
jgi:SHS2 domain-containing protein